MKKNHIQIITLLLIAQIAMQPTIYSMQPQLHEDPSEYGDNFDEERVEQKRKVLWAKLDKTLNVLERLFVLGCLGGTTYLMYRWGTTALFGQGDAKAFVPAKQSNVTFENYSGVPEEAQEFIQLVAQPRPHIKPPRGILLYGPPGTGKTFLAKVIAGELNKRTGKALFLQKGATEFAGPYVGIGERAMKAFFEQARELAKKEGAHVVLFIDEIDAIGQKRNPDQPNRSHEQILNQLLLELDGFSQEQNITLIAATNRSEVLDPALVRGGRLEKKIKVAMPEQEMRVELFKTMVRKAVGIPQENEVLASFNFDELSHHELSPSNINTIVEQANTAALLQSGPLTMDHLRTALAKCLQENQDIKQEETNLIRPERCTITLQDYTGVPQKITELVHLLKNPGGQFNVRPPKALLFYGAPGTGKTFLARAIAGELNLPFFYKAAPEFHQTYVGAGKDAVKALFREAKRTARERRSHAIIFIDELDSIGKPRASSLNSNQSDEVLNQLLVELDGFEPTDNVTLICATNKDPEFFDSALLRSGRIDEKIHIGLPNRESRKTLFANYLEQHQPYDQEIALDEFSQAELTPAAIKKVVEEAARKANLETAEAITAEHLKASWLEEVPQQSNTIDDDTEGLIEKPWLLEKFVDFLKLLGISNEARA